MNRRRLCAVLAGSVTAAAGCLGISRNTTTDEPTATATDEPTRTATATRTIPPYNRSLHTLRVSNSRQEPVVVVIQSRATDDERTMRLQLEPGESREYEDLDLLAEPVDVRVTIGGETTTYTPQSDGIIVVSVTADGVEFEEIVS